MNSKASIDTRKLVWPTVAILAAALIGILFPLFGNIVVLVPILIMLLGVVMLKTIQSPESGVLFIFLAGLFYFDVPLNIGSIKQAISPFKAVSLIVLSLWVLSLVSSRKRNFILSFINMQKNKIARFFVFLAIAIPFSLLIGWIRFGGYHQGRNPIEVVSSVFPYILVALLSITFLNSSKKIEKFILIMVIFGTSILGVSLIASFITENIGYSVTNNISILLGGTSAHRVGQWAVILWPYAFIWLPSVASSRRYFTLSLVFSLILALAVVGSASRASLIGLMLAISGVFITRRYGERKYKVVLIAIFFIILVSIVTNNSLFRETFERLYTLIYIFDANKAESIGGMSLIASQGRIFIYQRIIEIWRSDFNWLWGIGFGSFDKIYNHIYYSLSPWGFDIPIQDAHSLPLQLILELGIIGILLLVYLVYVLGKGLAGILNHYPDRNLALATVLSFVGILPTLLFQAPTLEDRQFYFVMIILASMYVLIEQQAKNKTPEFSSTDGLIPEGKIRK